MASLRRGPVLPALAMLALGAYAGMRAFVASPGSSVVALQARGGGEYDVSDADIEQFYQETMSGSGGAPPRKGLIEEMVVKFFLGDFTEKPDGKVDFQRASKYTGPGGHGLALYKAVPYGKRPLLVAKAADVDGTFAKINWDVALKRVEKTMGGPEIKQR